jgi:hypothetical protein
MHDMLPNSDQQVIEDKLLFFVYEQIPVDIEVFLRYHQIHASYYFVASRNE